MTPEQQALITMVITQAPNFIFALIACGALIFVIVRLLDYMRGCDCPPRRESNEPYTRTSTTTTTNSLPAVDSEDGA